MSVEIEVGLENAARVKAAPAQEFLLDEEPPKGLKNPKVRGLLVVGGLVLLAVLISLLVYYHNRETTDDAQVDGHITPIASKIYGRVAEVLVTDNQPVKAGQVLVKIDPRDYQASLDQAKAALALAESDAASAGVDVRWPAAIRARCQGGRGCRQGAGSAGRCTGGRRQRCAEEPLHHRAAGGRAGGGPNPRIGPAARRVSRGS